ncbi:MAG: N-acetylmuramoyl-L-alanine amidase [Bacillota bacterium]|nr:N-acetylmuramoyl-L-alanine amidase [Bacillota bacterium]
MEFKVYNPGNKKPFVKRISTNCIILHHAAAVTCTPGDIVKWHLDRGFNGAGYNWFVSKNGTIYQLRPIWAIGAHTIGWNSKSIGICAEGNYETEVSMPEVQIKAIAEVIDYCNDCYKTKLNLYGHRQKWSTACPGKNFPFNRISELSLHWDDIIKLTYPGKPLKYIPEKLMKGTNVKTVQQKLNNLGFNSGPADGVFGPKTLSAVKAFQKAKGIEIDGIVGPITWSKLFN